jgi:hypothetical protein
MGENHRDPDVPTPYLLSMRIESRPGTRRKVPANKGVSIGAPGFEPGTSPTRIMGEIRPADGKALQIGWLYGCSSSTPPLRSSDIAVDSRGLGRESEPLANGRGHRCRLAVARLVRLLDVHGAVDQPHTEQASDHARRQPLSLDNTREHLSPTAASVRARPAQRQQPPLELERCPHHVEPALQGPAPRQRSRSATLENPTRPHS